MARKLDIIVTHYREPWEVGKQFFDMLECQRGINFGDIRVILVQDGAEGTLWSGHVTNYSYWIMPIGIDHAGVSAARNAGLDASDAEWVMFCDFDDAFYHTYALAQFFRAMRDDRNIIVSKFLWEVMDPAGRQWLKTFEGNDCVFIHGKMFRRSWLMENNLRFDNELTVHEDSYFVTLAELVCCEGEIGRIMEPTYVWQYNPASVTRSEDDFTLRTFDHWVKKTHHLVGELVRRGMYSAVRIVLSDAMVDSYANFHSIGWNLPEFAEAKASALTLFDQLVYVYADTIAALPEDMIRRRREVRCTEKNGFVTGSQDYFEWIKERMNNSNGHEGND